MVSVQYLNICLQVALLLVAVQKSDRVDPVESGNQGSERRRRYHQRKEEIHCSITAARSDPTIFCDVASLLLHAVIAIPFMWENATAIVRFRKTAIERSPAPAASCSSRPRSTYHVNYFEHACNARLCCYTLNIARFRP